MAHAFTRHVVRFSGMSNSTSTIPLLSVVSDPAQKAVSANSVRTVGSATAASPPPPPESSSAKNESTALSASAPGAGAAMGASAAAIIGIAISAPRPSDLKLRERLSFLLKPKSISLVSSSSATRWPKMPRGRMASFFGSTMLPNWRPRLDSVCGLCRRRHFQKWARISGTLEPPEMYSTDLS